VSHSAAIAQYDDARPSMKALYLATRNDYADKFGHSVATREPKGIVIVPLVIPKKVEAAA
jgi:hypothetical protein